MKKLLIILLALVIVIAGVIFAIPYFTTDPAGPVDPDPPIVDPDPDPDNDKDPVEDDDPDEKPSQNLIYLENDGTIEAYSEEGTLVETYPLSVYDGNVWFDGATGQFYYLTSDMYLKVYDDKETTLSSVANPTFHADSKGVYFVQDDGIYTVRSTSGNILKVMNGEFIEDFWVEDDTILYVNKNGAKYELRSLSIDTGKDNLLASKTGEIEILAWTGQKVFFSSFVGNTKTFNYYDFEEQKFAQILNVKGAFDVSESYVYYLSSGTLYAMKLSDFTDVVILLEDLDGDTLSYSNGDLFVGDTKTETFFKYDTITKETAPLSDDFWGTVVKRTVDDAS